MTSIFRDSFGWIYLISGLVLTVAAIVIPAHQDLQTLKQKRAAIVEDTADLEHQIVIHQAFMDDLQGHDQALQARMINMQFNQTPEGTPVVIDHAASSTPLDWVAQRARQKRVVDLEEPRDSILAKMTDGKNRLWLAGAGVFVLFIGLITTTPQQLLTTES